eukprot:4532240-Prymnesium_polylepis.1
MVRRRGHSRRRCSRGLFHPLLFRCRFGRDFRLRHAPMPLVGAEAGKPLSAAAATARAAAARRNHPTDLHPVVRDAPKEQKRLQEAELDLARTEVLVRAGGR